MTSGAFVKDSSWYFKVSLSTCGGWDEAFERLGSVLGTTCEHNASLQGRCSAGYGYYEDLKDAKAGVI